MDYHNPNELRASSSGFMWGRMVFTTYKTACLRKILVQSRAVQAAIDPKYAHVGSLNEARHEKRIPEGTIYEREYAFKIPLTSSVSLSGHIDFVYFDASGNPTRLDELKSISSANSYRSIIKQGNYLIENLAQTINYMVAVKVQHARLIYTYYVYDEDAKEYTAKDERIFHVEIDDFGRIHIDGAPSRWCVGDQIAHQIAAAKVIASGEVAQRPELWDAPFASPCGYCPFSQACIDWDSGAIESSDAFVSICQNLSLRKDR